MRAATWASDGFWAVDGAYALISQIILFAWIAVLSGFLAMGEASLGNSPRCTSSSAGPHPRAA